MGGFTAGGGGGAFLSALPFATGARAWGLPLGAERRLTPGASRPTAASVLPPAPGPAPGIPLVLALALEFALAFEFALALPPGLGLRPGLRLPLAAWMLPAASTTSTTGRA